MVILAIISVVVAVVILDYITLSCYPILYYTYRFSS